MINLKFIDIYISKYNIELIIELFFLKYTFVYYFNIILCVRPMYLK